MTLKEKLVSDIPLVWLYGTTPPAADSTRDHIQLTAHALANRLSDLALDGVIVYDVQDESGRTEVPRPFPYMRSADSRVFAKTLHDLTHLEAITYKSIANLEPTSLNAWLDRTHAVFEQGIVSLVGNASSQHPSSMGLREAISQSSMHAAKFLLGGVAIAERYNRKPSETERMWAKVQAGCQYFVSQAVYAPQTTIALLHDYKAMCVQHGVAPKRFILTFVPCGRPKTMQFIRWLGIDVSVDTEADIFSNPNPLERSIQICEDNFDSIMQQCQHLGIPLGVNVESVSINKAELDGASELFKRLKSRS